MVRVTRDSEIVLLELDIVQLVQLTINITVHINVALEGGKHCIGSWLSPSEGGSHDLVVDILL
jgi:hypothetical protein